MAAIRHVPVLMAAPATTSMEAVPVRLVSTATLVIKVKNGIIQVSEAEKMTDSTKWLLTLVAAWKNEIVCSAQTLLGFQLISVQRQVKQLFCSLLKCHSLCQCVLWVSSVSPVLSSAAVTTAAPVTLRQEAVTPPCLKRPTSPYTQVPLTLSPFRHTTVVRCGHTLLCRSF